MTWPILFLAVLLFQIPVCPPQDRPGVRMLPVPCLRVTHSHLASDLKLALVKVREVGACEFTYEDLEQRSVNVEPIVATDARLFELAQATFDDKTVKVNLPAIPPAAGAFGILVYCAHCRAGCLLLFEKAK